MKTDLSCVYASGVLINDPILLGSLAIFYDKIQLPHAYDVDPDAKQLISWPSKKWEDLEYYQTQYVNWKNSHKELFDANILEVLPAPIDLDKDEPMNLAEQLLGKLGSKLPHFTSSQAFSGRLAIAMHALFSNTEYPEFIISNSNDTSTVHLQQILATSLFKYQIPIIGKLNPEQILEIREKTKTYKKGFISYMNQELDEVENRMTSSNINEIEATLRTIERNISPEYEEFISQELPSKIKWWSSISKKGLGIIGGSLKIVTSFWNFKNYIDPLSSVSEMGEMIGSRAEERAKNKHKAFQFISAINKR